MLCKLTRSYVCHATFRRKFLVSPPLPSPPLCRLQLPSPFLFRATTASPQQRSRGGPFPPPHQPHPTTRHYTTSPPPHPDKTRSGRAAQGQTKGRRSGLPLAGAPQLFPSQSPRHRRSIDSDSAWLWRLPVTASAAASRWLLVAFVSTRAIGDPAFSVLGRCSASATTVAFPSPIRFAVIDRRRWRRSRSRPASSESTLPSSSRYRLLSLKIRVILLRTNHGRVTGCPALARNSSGPC
jgi:hypothetical protein